MVADHTDTEIEDDVTVMVDVLTVMEEETMVDTQ